MCNFNCADYGDHPSSSPLSAVTSCGLLHSLRNYIPSSNPGAPICAKNTSTTEVSDDGNYDDEYDLKKLDDSRGTEARKTLVSGIHWEIMNKKDRTRRVEVAVLVDEYLDCCSAKVVSIPQPTLIHISEKGGHGVIRRSMQLSKLWCIIRNIGREGLDEGTLVRSPLTAKEIGPIMDFIRCN